MGHRLEKFLPSVWLKVKAIQTVCLQPGPKVIVAIVLLFVVAVITTFLRLLESTDRHLQLWAYLSALPMVVSLAGMAIVPDKAWVQLGLTDFNGLSYLFAALATIFTGIFAAAQAMYGFRAFKSFSYTKEDI